MHWIVSFHSTSRGRSFRALSTHYFMFSYNAVLSSAPSKAIPSLTLKSLSALNGAECGMFSQSKYSLDELHWTEVNFICNISRGWQKSTVGVFSRCHHTSTQDPVSQSLHLGTNINFRNSCPCFCPFLLIPPLFCMPSAQSWQVFAESCCEPDQWLSQSKNQRASILITSVQLKLWIP